MEFNFDVGDPMPIGDWLTRWIKEAPSKELMWDSRGIVWSIWCFSNLMTFKVNLFIFYNVLAHFAGIKRIIRIYNQKCGKEDGAKDDNLSPSLGSPPGKAQFTHLKDQMMLVIC